VEFGQCTGAKVMFWMALDQSIISFQKGGSYLKDYRDFCTVG
jgi:hypothetical protein